MIFSSLNSLLTWVSVHIWHFVLGMVCCQPLPYEDYITIDLIGRVLDVS